MSSRSILGVLIVFGIVCAGGIVVLSKIALDQRKQMALQAGMIKELRLMVAQVVDRTSSAAQDLPGAVQASPIDVDDESRIELHRVAADLVRLHARLDAIESRFETTPAAEPEMTGLTDPGEIRGPDLLSESSSARIELESRVRALERAIDDLASRISEPGRGRPIDLSQLENSLARVTDDQRELKRQLNLLSTTMREIEWAGDNRDIPRLVQDVERRLESLERSVQSLDSNRERISVQRSIDRLESDVSSMERQIDDALDRIRRLESDR